MNLQEIKQAVEAYLNHENSILQVDVNHEMSAYERFRLRTVKRLKRAFDLYGINSAYQNDFLLALRDYLLVFKTKIRLDHVSVPENDFAIVRDEQTGEYFCTYQFPDYVTAEFIKQAFLDGWHEYNPSAGEFDLLTDPMIYKTTGYIRFKSIAQKIAVYGALNTPDGYTTLVSLPTGGGKSLITQTMAYQKDGLTIVVMPTVSLAIDQVRTAKKTVKTNAPEQEIFAYYGGVNSKPILDAIRSRTATIQRMIRLVQSADAGKARIVGMADRWATWIVVGALSAAGLTWLISGEIIRAVTILVVFCPCSLVLATPTAIMAAIGNATKHGFLVREGDALERLAKVSKITFDKTGTLTCGTPEVTAVRTVSGYSKEEIYAMAAAVESLSEHPLGKAVVRGFGKTAELPEAVDFEMTPGMGVRATVNGRLVQAGSQKLIGKIPEEAENDIHSGATLIYVTVDQELAGYLVLSDTLRPESKTMLSSVQALNVEPVLLTGDNQMAAEYIGNSLGIREVYAQCLPEDKLQHIDSYQAAGAAVCMIGDGVNDAPALKKADVGIAMGGVGSDIAVDAADIALVDDDIKELPHLLALSQRMMGTIKLNLTFSMGLNFLAIALAITGLLGPVVGALVHNTGSVLVIINSALLLRYRR